MALAGYARILENPDSSLAEKRRQAFWASMLFAVYPGFSQQWISVIYSEAFIILAAFLASLAL